MEKPISDYNSEQQGAPQLFQSRVLTAIFGPNATSFIMRLVAIVVSIGTLAIIAVGLFSPSTSLIAPHDVSQGAIGLQVGDAAPNFTLATLAGKRTSLSDYRGKPVMLNFWYATCPGCLVETFSMQRFYAAQHAAGKDFTLLAVNTIDDVPTAQQFVHMYRLTYQIVMDDNQRVSTLYNLGGTPTSYFIDRQGIIRSVVVGPVDDPTLQQDVAKIS